MAKQPSVLHVSTPISWRGGEQQIYYLHNNLKELGVVQFVITPFHSELSKRGKSEGWNIIEAKKKSGFDLRFAKAISKTCRQNGIDIIHVHDSHAHTLAVLSHTLFGNTAPIVVHRRVDYGIHSGGLSKWKYNHTAVKAILCVSNKIKEVMTPAIKEPTKLKVVYSGIDLEKFNIPKKTDIREILGLSPDTSLVVSIGALSQQKDMFTFIDTVKILKQTLPDVSFAILGDGPQAEETKTYAENEVPGVIHFMGFRTDIPVILPQVNLLLNTPEMEGLGTTFLDAMACGVPIVATNTGGIPEIITDGKNGFLCPVKDAKALAKKTIQLLQDVNLQTEFAEEGKKVVQEFTHLRTAEKTLEIDREILKTQMGKYN